MTRKGERYRNRYTGALVTVAEVESVRTGPGDVHKDVVVLENGTRWGAGDGHWPNPQFHACYELMP